MKALAVPLIAFLTSVAALVAGLCHQTRLEPVGAPIPEDRAAYRSTCAQCHPPFSPRVYLKTQWRKVVEEMLARADHRGIEIDQETLELVIGYLEENGR